MSFTNVMMSKINDKLQTFKNFIRRISHIRQLSSNPNCSYEELQESFDMVLETNVSLRRQLIEKQAEIEKAKQTNLSLKQEFETKEVHFEEDRRFFFEQIKSLRNELVKKEEQVEKAEEQHLLLKKEYEKKITYFKSELEKSTALLKENKYELEQMMIKLREDLNHSYKGILKKILREKDAEILNFERNNDKLIKELQSVRAMLELKQREIKCLQLVVAEAKQKEELLKISLERIELLRARCENLQDQLRRRSEYIEDLETDVTKLSKFITKENKPKQNLLDENNGSNSKNSDEVVTEILENFLYDLQDSQNSPKIINLVRNGQSIGYILDLDETKKSKIASNRIEKLKRGKSVCDFD